MMTCLRLFCIGNLWCNIHSWFILFPWIIKQIISFEARIVSYKGKANHRSQWPRTAPHRAAKWHYQAARAVHRAIWRLYWRRAADHHPLPRFSEWEWVLHTDMHWWVQRGAKGPCPQDGKIVAVYYKNTMFYKCSGLAPPNGAPATAPADMQHEDPPNWPWAHKNKSGSRWLY